MSTGGQWAVVVPVKELRRAKTRLAHLDAESRAELALAMAADVVAAAVAADPVAGVVVVTNDLLAASTLAAAGARVVADSADAGIDAALVEAARTATTLWPRCGVAALSADLPCVTPAELGHALDRAAAHSRSIVADRTGDGTTLLAVAPGVPLDPRYGRASRARHVLSGAHQLAADDLPGLTLDVDTAEDLDAALALGPGPRTAAVMLRRDRGR